MSYVPTPTQAPTPQAARSHSGMKGLTIIGACIAVLFLILSVVLGLGARSTHQAARQAQSDAQSLRDQAKETETETATTRTKINDATNKKEAQAWPDGDTPRSHRQDLPEEKGLYRGVHEGCGAGSAQARHSYLHGWIILGDNHRIRLHCRSKFGGRVGVRRRARDLPHSGIVYQGLSALGSPDDHRSCGRNGDGDIGPADALFLLRFLHYPPCEYVAQRGLSA